jgi:hypothetical protein
MRPTLFAAAVALTVALATPSPTQAEVTPDTVAPPLSFCIGKTTTCVMPDFNLSTVNYDLKAKKWEVGTTTFGIGYMLLLASDRPYASGVAVHIAGQWSQSTPSYLALAPTLVLAKYFEVGATVRLMDGGVDTVLSFGLGANSDTLVALLTDKNLGDRLRTARLQAGETP